MGREIWLIALIALPAIILGGLDSMAGAVIGGLAVGVVRSLVGTYQGDIAPWWAAGSTAWRRTC